jgi:alkyl hydroperoxide reductase subunit AhpF
MIGEREQNEIRKILGNMTNPVKIINFTQTFECDTCHDTRLLLEELTALDDKLSLEVLNFTIDKEKAAEYGIDKIPATILESNGTRGPRLYGVPAGYEFASLLDAIVLTSRGESGLSPQSRELVAKITEPLHIEVLVTPT